MKPTRLTILMILFTFSPLFSGLTIAKYLAIDFNSNFADNGTVYSKTVQTAKRSYFYLSPTNDCKEKDLFLIKGDKVTSYMAYNGFEFISYINKGGGIVSGWMLSSNLINETTSNIIKINKNDFFIYTTKGQVALDSSFETFYKSWGQHQENQESDEHYFITTGTTPYKAFYRAYPDFNLIISNTNHAIKNRDFDDYRISTIKLTNGRTITSRGAHIGSTRESVLNKYGHPNEEENKELAYIVSDMKLDFVFNESSLVSSITLEITPQ